jgi:hypothetical protein
MTAPEGGRDPLEVRQEIVDEARRQVANGLSESDALQREQAAWMDAWPTRPQGRLATTRQLTWRAIRRAQYAGRGSAPVDRSAPAKRAVLHSAWAGQR